LIRWSSIIGIEISAGIAHPRVEDNQRLFGGKPGLACARHPAFAPVDCLLDKPDEAIVGAAGARCLPVGIIA